MPTYVTLLGLDKGLPSLLPILPIQGPWFQGLGLLPKPEAHSIQACPQLQGLCGQHTHPFALTWGSFLNLNNRAPNHYPTPLNFGWASRLCDTNRLLGAQASPAPPCPLSWIGKGRAGVGSLHYFYQEVSSQVCMADGK
jgi:hypothetical protein